MIQIDIAHEHIHGDRFASLADMAINWPRNSKRTDMVLRTGHVVFCKTDYVLELFDYLRDTYPDARIVLITHNSDIVVDDTLWARRPPQVARWFAANATTQRDGLTCIPLGIERPYGGGYSSDFAVMADALAQGYNRDSLIYVNFNAENNRGERAPALAHFADKPWATNVPHGTSFRDYCHAVAKHVFVACPEGNGPDTHRVWEALYMGAIPVLRRTAWSMQWVDLPVVYVDDWRDVAPRRLRAEASVLNDTAPRATMSYWAQEIDKARACLRL